MSLLGLEYNAKLRDLDFIVDMSMAEWQSAPLLVPNKNSRAWMRLAVDLRPANAATVKEVWPMPHLEAEVNDFATSKCFACLDFVSSYCLLPLDPDSYSASGLITPLGVVLSMRVLQGLANSTAHFQRSIEPLFSELRENMKPWVDDFIVHAATESKLLQSLEKVFAICERRSLYFSTRKCVPFCTTNQVVW